MGDDVYGIRYEVCGHNSLARIFIAERPLGTLNRATNSRGNEFRLDEYRINDYRFTFHPSYINSSTR